MNAKEQLIQDNIDSLRIRLLSGAARVEQFLFEMYNEDVRYGYLTYEMFRDNVYEVFGEEFAKGLDITIQKE